MPDRDSADLLYTACLTAFLGALVGLGLLGVPALLVGAIGLGAAALGIALFHRRLEARDRAGRGRASKRSRVPAKYVPSVLEGSSTRRRRTIHIRRRQHADPPFRFR
ncbi:MAG TPA: hypothetical protein VMF55_05740 [Solirubrobacterales bacterium]|nr:hypothetical protein [Solirubrobacterales bacterium]